MPRFDGSGPQGMGPMTGGGRGMCNPVSAGYGPRFAGGMGMRRGFRGGGNYGMRGMGRGPGRGYGNYPVAYRPYPVDDTAEIDMLKAQAEAVKSDLEMINQRIAELEKGVPETND